MIGWPVYMTLLHGNTNNPSYPSVINKIMSWIMYEVSGSAVLLEGEKSTTFSLELGRRLRRFAAFSEGVHYSRMGSAKSKTIR